MSDPFSYRCEDHTITDEEANILRKGINHCIQIQGRDAILQSIDKLENGGYAIIARFIPTPTDN